MNSTEFRRQVCYPVYVRLKRLVNSPLHLPLTLPPDEANRMIYEGLTGPSPLMVGRFGSVELCTLIAYLNAMELNRVQQLLRRFRFEPIGFTPKIRYMSCNNAGFFPPDAEHLKGFCELMFADMKEVDILGCWRPEELRVRKYLPANLQTTKLGSLEPFTFKSPWSAALAGKKVLVIHPFKKSILRQYERREKLFANPEILPDFDLRVIAAVQSMGGVSTYKDWFEALDSMKQEIDQTDYDIALIGAGAYGFPLAAHVKRQGKKAVHWGGSLQLLFGIYGNRWINSPLINEYWVRPLPEEAPGNSDKVENKCYW